MLFTASVRSQSLDQPLVPEVLFFLDIALYKPIDISLYKPILQGLGLNKNSIK